MTYKFELFIVTQKMAYKNKIIQTLSYFNLIYRVRYMIRFLMFCLYWTSHFLYWINSLSTKI